MSETTTAPKKKYQYFFSPKGVSVYPKLIAADYKFKKEFGEFSTKLTHKLTQAGVQELIKAIDAEAEKSLEAMAKELDGKKDKRGKAIVAKLCEDLPYFINEEDGTATFSYKMSASYKDKKTGQIVNKRPNLFDANGTPIKDFAKLNIGGGSELVVNFYFQHWNTEKLGAGVRLNMSDVQIVTLKEFTRDPGFAKQEGGFVNAPDTSGNDAADDQDASTPDNEGTDASNQSPDPENF
jgi:hypothetical protein